jgi:hypothetical protein
MLKGGSIIIRFGLTEVSENLRFPCDPRDSRSGTEPGAPPVAYLGNLYTAPGT